jgi:hypothetical protein
MVAGTIDCINGTINGSDGSTAFAFDKKSAAMSVSFETDRPSPDFSLVRHFVFKASCCAI